MVQRHEPPRRVDQRIDHRQVQLVTLGDGSPVVDAGPAERIGADPHPGFADDVDIDHVRQIVDIGVQIVVAPGGLQRPSQRHPLDARSAVAQNLVGALGDYVGGVGVGGAAVGRVVLEAAVGRRVVRRRHDDPVGQPLGAAAVVREDRVAYRRRRRVPVAESITATTSLAASTSSADTQAGSESPCVSRPTNNGPVVPCAARYSTMA